MFLSVKQLLWSQRSVPHELIRNISEKGHSLLMKKTNSLRSYGIYREDIKLFESLTLVINVLVKSAGLESPRNVSGMWAVAGWIESQMAEIPSIFARGHSRSLCLFVCGGPLWHKGFSQTCACIPSPPLSTPAVPARAPLASCPDERQLTRFCVHFVAHDLFRHHRPSSQRHPRLYCSPPPMAP